MTSFDKSFSTMPNQPEVTAIVVSWNVRAQLERCITALKDSVHVQLHIVVIDNASSDGSADMIAAVFPDVRLIRNHTNRGFAAAVNQGIAVSHGDVVLINPDLAVQPQTLHLLEDALTRDRHVGIVGPRITYPDGTLQPSIRRFPRTRDLMLTLMKLPNFFPLSVGRYAGLDLDYSLEQTVDQVMGSCFLIRRAALEAVGSFDEKFYIWFEEVDYCKRAANRGWKTLYVPAAQALHEKGASFRQLPPLKKHQILRRSMTHYAKKHLGFLAGELIFAAGIAATLLAGIQQLLHLRKPEAARDL